MNQSTNQFRLDVRLENKLPMKIDVIDTITAGLDPRNDLVLIGDKINNRHLVFSKKGENLALQYLGNTNQTFLNNIPLEEGKTYILGPGDKIILKGAEIIVESELITLHETQRIKPNILNSISRVTPDSITDGIPHRKNITTITENIVEEPPKMTEKKTRQPFFKLWLIKLYSMVVDAFITYFVLIILLPLVFVDNFAKSIFNYLSSLVFPNYNHSFFSFLVAWYLLSFAQTLVFGSTIGQSFLGLRNVPDNTFGRLILYRMKTFVYSLFLLPSQNTVKNNLVYKAIRNVVMIIILFLILAAPFILPAPYNTQITLLRNEQVETKDHQTKTIMSYSKDLEMRLSAELSNRYYLLPNIVNISKRSFELIDLISGESITVSEVDDQSYEQIEAQLKYSNPLYSGLHSTPLSQSSMKEKKAIIQSIFLLSPQNLVNDTLTFGPFFGSGLLVKKSLINADLKGVAVLKSYNPSTPLFFLSGNAEEYFYLLGPKRMTRFLVKSKNNVNLLTVFEQELLTKLTAETGNFVNPNNHNLTILEAQDAFLHGDEQSFLTYYQGVANTLSNVKILHAETDYTDTAKLAVIKNIESVLKFIKNKIVYRSFNDIKNQLAPMEKPGE